MSVSPNQPVGSSKNVMGDFDAFVNFTRQILSVPHSEIKEKLDAEKAAKRTSKFASRVSAVPSKGT
jgi:hypothetical protein